MKAKHTAGRLEMEWNGREGRYEFAGGDGAKLGHFCGWSADGVTTEQEDFANTERLRDCWNACAGLNPEAVPGLVVALRKVANCSRYPSDDAGNMEYALDGLRKIARAALALAQVQP